MPVRAAGRKLLDGRLAVAGHPLEYLPHGAGDGLGVLRPVECPLQHIGGDWDPDRHGQSATGWTVRRALPVPVKRVASLGWLRGPRVTQREAECLLGVHVSAVQKMGAPRRPTPRDGRPSLSRAQVIERAAARAAAASDSRPGVRRRDRTSTTLLVPAAAALLGGANAALDGRGAGKCSVGRNSTSSPNRNRGLN